MRVGTAPVGLLFFSWKKSLLEEKAKKCNYQKEHADKLKGISFN